jgi:hypothetical protein
VVDKRLIALAATVVCACSSPASTPTQPSPAPEATPSSTFVGTLVATNGSQALAGISVSGGATTDAAGHFTLAAGATVVTFSGASIVTRVVNLQQPAHAFTADAIVLNTGFDLNFFRALVRDAYATPGLSRPLQRWTASPNVYIRTIDEGGRQVDDVTLSVTAGAISDVAPMWTGGRFNISTIVRGTETREGIPGWITVKWGAAATSVCGTASVGNSGGFVELDRLTPNCQCSATESTAMVRPSTVKHEMGHAFGFYHTGNQADLMSGFGDVRCNFDPTDREKYHAAIAYSRPVGNIDPDTDPAGIGPLSVREPMLVIVKD